MSRTYKDYYKDVDGVRKDFLRRKFEQFGFDLEEKIW